MMKPCSLNRRISASLSGGGRFKAAAVGGVRVAAAVSSEVRRRSRRPDCWGCFMLAIDFSAVVSGGGYGCRLPIIGRR